MSKDLFKNINFLELIDWNHITSLITSFSTFDKTRDFFSSTAAFLSVSELELTLRQQDFLISQPSGFSRISQHLFKLDANFDNSFCLDLSKGRVLSLEQLNRIALLLELDQIWIENFSKNLLPSQTDLFITQPLFNSKVLYKLRSFVSETGYLNETGFTELSELNHEILMVEASARKKASDLLRSSSLIFSDSGEFDIINDRYVLPVSSDHYNSNYGPIIHRSRTGLTLFVEPFELKPFSQKRSDLLAKKEWLIFKKCKELSEICAPFSQALFIWSDLVLLFDKLLSLQMWGKSFELSRPVLSSEKEIILNGLFHPLIRDCVRNNLDLSSSHQGLILSGPNTGGKTVFLKTVAVCIALMRIGSWIPAQFAKLYPYEQLFFFSNDLQDINQGLSSFSSEVSNYSSLLNDLNDDAVVFIDEIFNSTSSEEASALAISLLEFLSSTKKPNIFLSTHHHGVKTTGTTMEDFISSHMTATDKGEPLYKINYGNPGSSRGIQTFGRITAGFDWSHSITHRAMDLIGSNIFDYEKALVEISDAKRLTDNLNAQLTLQLKQLKSDKEAFELTKNLSLEKEKNLLKQEFDSHIKIIQREFDSFKNKESSQKKVLNIITEKSRFFKTKAPQESLPDNLAPLRGDLINKRVWSISLKKFGIVLKSKNDKLYVDSKGLKSWVKSSDLLLDNQGGVNPQSIFVSYEKSSLGQTSLDTRGWRLEAFQKAVTDSLLELHNGEIPYLDIVHGHGEGILKKWLRNYLKTETDFQWSPQDGNDGVTRVTVAR